MFIHYLYFTARVITTPNDDNASVGQTVKSRDIIHGCMMHAIMTAVCIYDLSQDDLTMSTCLFSNLPVKYSRSVIFQIASQGMYVL